jgi:hypothetical protein
VKVTAPTDLVRRVWLVAGVLALGLAGACGLLRGPADAVGVLLGSGLTLLNFGGLTWMADRALKGGGRPRTRALWVGASGIRLGLAGGLVGLAVTHTGIGLTGLLLSLTLLPVAVILGGLRAARAA